MPEDLPRSEGDNISHETQSKTAAAERYVWAWPVPAVIVVASAGAVFGWPAAVAATALAVAGVGALLASLARWKVLSLVAFLAATVVSSGLVIRSQASNGSGRSRPQLASGALTVDEVRARRDLRGSLIAGLQLSGMDLRNRLLQGAHAAGASLAGATLDGSRLDGADLARVDLRGASLKGVCLRGVDLTGAVVDGADFNHASVEGANGGNRPAGGLHWDSDVAPTACK